jgi:hypothetical protein
MDRYESAALLDFVASVIWPSRTVALVTAGGGQSTFDVVGTWATATDLPMAWINGQRVTGAITWVDANTVTLPVTAPLGSQVIILITPGSGSGYLPRNPAGVTSMLGDLLMGNHTIDNLGAASQAHQAVRLDQVAQLIKAQLGGNYIARAGDQMAGVLKLIAANLIVDAAAAVRRDMVALLDGSQDFTGKIRGVSTSDGDHAQTLTTKDWVEAYVQAALADTQAPNQEEVFATAGAGYTFTVGVDCASTVRKLWIYTKGGKGGAGGASTYAGQGGPGGLGALGGKISGSIPVADGAVLTVVVGGNGQSGSGYSVTTKKTASGGGGGGASQVSVGTDSITGGGGGGGSGGGINGYKGGSGGAGGQVGGDGQSPKVGGIPGNTITTAGGVGGARSNGAGNAGTVGSGAITAGFNSNDTFPFQTITDPNAVTGSGLVIIKWYE